MWRQKKYPCGEILDIEIFTRPEKAKVFKRARREKESSPAQKNLNNKNSNKYFVRLVHKNFKRKDLSVDLTIADQFMPKTREAAQKMFKNYIARVNRWRRAQGLKNLIYVYVLSEHTELGKATRFHFHLYAEKMDREVLEDKWGMGYANTDRLDFNELGVQGKSQYMARQSSYSGCRTWGSSIGLKKPEAITSDKAITKADINRIVRNPEDRAWFFTSCEVEENLITGTNILIKMRKEEIPDYISKARKKEYMEHIDIPF